MSRECNYKDLIMDCGCPDITIKHINIDPGTTEHKIPDYEYICNTELPLSSGVVDLKCLKPNVSSIIVVKKNRRMTIYDFMIVEKPTPNLEYKFLFNDGSCSVVQKMQSLPEHKNIYFILVGAGGNGASGTNGENGSNSDTVTSKETVIGRAGKGGAGGAGGAGGGAGDVVRFDITTGDKDVLKYTIGFNCEKSCGDLSTSRNTVAIIEKANEVISTYIAAGGVDAQNPGFPGGNGGAGEIAVTGTNKVIIQNAEAGSVGGGDYGGKGGPLSSANTTNLLGGGGGGAGAGGKGSLLTIVPRNILGLAVQIINTLTPQTAAGEGGMGGPATPTDTLNGADGAPGIRGFLGGGGNGGQGGGGGGGGEWISAGTITSGGIGGKGSAGGLGGDGFIFYYYIN